jgi:antitoxin (DNA-binding transcriptional repressor) of toxin-antitoxin stability system
MQTVTLDEAKTHLVDLIDAAAAGVDIFITKDERLSVQLVPRPVKERKRQFGSAKGLISMVPDFDAPFEIETEDARQARRERMFAALTQCDEIADSIEGEFDSAEDLRRLREQRIADISK